VDLAEGRTNAGFTITIRHANGVHSHVSASKLNHLNLRELRAYGEAGSYVSQGSDVPAQAIFAGKRPVQDWNAWGYEPKANWGCLNTSAGSERIPAEQGRYHDYYEAFAKAVDAGAPPPVSAAEGINTLVVLDAASRSAEEGRSIKL